MANNDLIRGGTASVTSGQTAVTGQNVSWANVLEGDFFGAHVGLAVPIQSVVGDVITLAYPWPGPTQATAAYAIQPKGDSIRFGLDVRNLLVALSDGDLAAIAALPTEADKLAFFTGPGAAALTDLKSVARLFLRGNFFPVQQGGGDQQTTNKVYVGWSVPNKLRAQVDNVDLGAIWTDSLATAPVVNANAGYTKLPNGLILQWGHFSPTVGSENRNFPVTFPTLVLGVYFTANGGTADNVAITQFGSELNLATFVVRTRRIAAGGVDAIGFPVSWFAIGA